MAARLAARLSSVPGVTVVQPVSINMVFVEMPASLYSALLERGYGLSQVNGSPSARGVPRSDAYLRFRLMTHWAVLEEHVDGLVHACHKEMDGRAVPD
jgi:threonine aldolase